ncbi:MAG TPA: hypothetical protein VGI10_21235 [Polyangiaceae bacterium]
MLERVAVAVLVGSLGFLGCGGSSDSGSGVPPGSGGSGGESEMLHPPPNINTTVCGSYAYADPACQPCCTSNSFNASTEYNNQCVCGNAKNAADATTCASQTATFDACTSCCTGAGYSGSALLNNACSCNGKSDATVCASTLSASDPSTACRVCCLNNGYLGESYVGFGTPECQCDDF